MTKSLEAVDEVASAAVIRFKKRFPEAVVHVKVPDLSLIHICFIAEQVNEVYPIAADCETGSPRNWEMRYLIPPMLALIQQQKKEIEQLKNKSGGYCHEQRSCRENDKHTGKRQG